MINFNTITYSIAMSKNTGPEKLAQEFATLQSVMEPIEIADKGSAIILARVIHGLSCEQWQEAAASEPLTQWQALPLENPGEEEPADPFPFHSLQLTPFREVRGVLTKCAFMSLLKRELVRLGRVGGSLSVIGATLANRSQVTTALGRATVARLDEMLGLSLLAGLDDCDGLGLLREGVFACSLPGMGQLAARRFAETSSDAFMEAARPFFPAGGLGAGLGCGCAMGIVNILPGDVCNPQDLLKRLRSTLDIALNKQGVRIHQETTATPLTGPTLVHSSEKRFLFFGGDPT